MTRLLIVLVILFTAPGASHADVYCQRPIVAGKLEELDQAVQLENWARNLLYKDGNYDQALLYYKQVDDVRSRLWGPKNLGLLSTLMDMALCYRARGDFKQAEETYKRVLTIEEGTPSGTPKAIAGTLERYACLMWRLGRQKEARQLNERSMLVVSAGVQKSEPLTGAVVYGTKISSPQPKYPKYVRRQKLSGTVNVRIVIDVDGKVISACAIDGPPPFAQAAEAAAMAALYTPTRLNGTPITITGTILYNFVW